MKSSMVLMACTGYKCEGPNAGMQVTVPGENIRSTLRHCIVGSKVLLVWGGNIKKAKKQKTHKALKTQGN